MGNVCSIARGGSPRPIEEYLTTDSNGINWIKIGDTEKDGKYILKTKEKILPTGLYKSRYVKSGDFLLTNSMSFGRPYILKTDGCIHDGWLVIGETDKVFYQDFLYYMLSSTFMYKSMSGLAAGSTVKNLKSESVKSLLIPIPSINEQKRISSKLEECIKLLDIINISKQEIIKIKDNIKERILCLAIQGKLVKQDPHDEPASVLLGKIREERKAILGKKYIDSYIYKADDNCYYEKVGEKTINITRFIQYNIPQSWAWSRLGNVADIITGATPDKNNQLYYGGNFPFYKPNDLEQNRHVLISSEKLSQEGINIVRKIPANSIGVCCIGSIGKCGFFEKEGATNQQINTIIPYIDNVFMYYICSSNLFKNQLLEKASATTIAIVNKNKMSSIFVAIPPINEQRQIANLIEKIFILLKDEG